MSKLVRLTRFVAFGLIGLVAVSAHAALEPATIKGKVVQFIPDGQWMAVQLEDGKVVLAGLDKRRVEDRTEYKGIPEPKIEVLGEQSIKILKPGMFIRFSAKVVNERRITEAIEQVSIFERDENSVFGLLPNQLGPAPGGPENQDANTEQPKPPRRDDDEDDDQDAQDMLVAGQLTGVRGASITVAFPDRKPLKARLSPNATVKIESAGISMIRPGDLVEVTGLVVKPNKMFATEVKIDRSAGDDKNRRRGQREARAERNEGDDANAFNPGADKKDGGQDKPADAAGDVAGADPPKADKPAEYKGLILRIN